MPSERYDSARSYTTTRRVDGDPTVAVLGRVRDPPANTHQVNVCHRLHAVKTPAIPGETGLRAMRCSHRHVSDDALTASSGPEDAQFRPRIGLPRGFHARRSSGSTSRRAIGEVRPSSKLGG